MSQKTTKMVAPMHIFCATTAFQAENAVKPATAKAMNGLAFVLIVAIFALAVRALFAHFARKTRRKR